MEPSELKLIAHVKFPITFPQVMFPPSVCRLIQNHSSTEVPDTATLMVLCTTIIRYITRYIFQCLNPVVTEWVKKLPRIYLLVESEKCFFGIDEGYVTMNIKRVLVWCFCQLLNTGSFKCDSFKQFNRLIAKEVTTRVNATLAKKMKSNTRHLLGRSVECECISYETLAALLDLAGATIDCIRTFCHCAPQLREESSTAPLQDQRHRKDLYRVIWKNHNQIIYTTSEAGLMAVMSERIHDRNSFDGFYTTTRYRPGVAPLEGNYNDGIVVLEDESDDIEDFEEEGEDDIFEEGDDPESLEEEGEDYEDFVDAAHDMNGFQDNDNVIEDFELGSDDVQDFGDGNNLDDFEDAVDEFEGFEVDGEDIEDFEDGVGDDEGFEEDGEDIEESDEGVDDINLEDASNDGEFEEIGNDIGEFGEGNNEDTGEDDNVIIIMFIEDFEEDDIEDIEDPVPQPEENLDQPPQHPADQPHLEANLQQRLLLPPAQVNLNPRLDLQHILLPPPRAERQLRPQVDFLHRLLPLSLADRQLHPPVDLQQRLQPPLAEGLLNPDADLQYRLLPHSAQGQLHLQAALQQQLLPLHVQRQPRPQAVLQQHLLSLPSTSTEGQLSLEAGLRRLLHVQQEDPDEHSQICDVANIASHTSDSSSSESVIMSDNQVQKYTLIVLLVTGLVMHTLKKARTSMCQVDFNRIVHTLSDKALKRVKLGDLAGREKEGKKIYKSLFSELSQTMDSPKAILKKLQQDDDAFIKALKRHLSAQIKRNVATRFFSAVCRAFLKPFQACLDKRY